jgi:mono/diheme cytochrome c family protein
VSARRFVTLAILAGTSIGAASLGGVDAAGVRARETAAASSASPVEQQALLSRYCITCHNERLKTGGLALDRMDVSNVAPHAEAWEKVVRKLRAGVMPPAGRPRPDKAAYDALTAGIEAALDRSAVRNPNPGRTPAFHRLNRTEYRNAIRDLLALDLDVAAVLPADDASYGFDNIGDILGVTPALIEGYLEAARRVSQEAIGDPLIAQETYTYSVAADLTQDYRLEGLPFGTRGGTVIHHHFPVDGEYTIAVRLLRNFIGGIMGLAEPHQLEVSVDGERVQVFPIGGRRPRAADGDAEAQESGNRALAADAGLNVRVTVKAGPRAVAATFIERSSVENEDLRPPYLRSFAVLSDFANGQPHIASVAITGPYSADVGTTPSRQRIFVCRPLHEADEAPCARRILSELARRAYRRPVTDEDLKPLLAFYESGRKASDAPGGSRPVSGEQGPPRVESEQSGAGPAGPRKRSEPSGVEGPPRVNFDAGIQRGLQRLLVSPEFLVRIERDRPSSSGNGSYPISDLELASRLSFFLWSSLPDDELLKQAEANRLRKPAVLTAQVRRMLADERSRALVNNFAAQWLYLRNVPAARPDTQIFPDFDENLRQAFRRETELLFETIMREDRSVLDLIGARYTFLNERLARHYGIGGVYGSQFRRVTLPADSVRGGLLGQGSILTVTSYPNRTSPVLRGKWILENVFGSGPPPPPPDVPELGERSEDGRLLSMRQRMAQHRSNAVCASCHTTMDSLGLPLENFDAVGAWRDRGESNDAIDASGTMPDGTPFTGARELREALLRHPGPFLTALTEKLLTYAVGRGLAYYDAPAVRAITREAARRDYAFSAIVLGIVNSVPFQMRRSPIDGELKIAD